jgi:excinuclease ABC subunit A
MSLRAGAIAPWGTPEGVYYARMLQELQAAVKVDADKPFRALPARTRERILHGGGGYEGVLPGLERRLAEWSRKRDGDDGGEWLEEELSPFMQRDACEACHGTRLDPRALAVRLDGKNIHELSSLALSHLDEWLRARSWPGVRARVAEPIVRELLSRLRVLSDLGLGYLSAARAGRTLSRGEAERIRLAAQLGTGLCGVLYVLDEPTAGLHPRDTERLLATLGALRDRGNTLLVVEHDLDVIAAADFVIDLGPGAGERGGMLMAAGTPAEVAASGSPTARFLAGETGEPVRARERGPSTGAIQIRGARTHNLAGIDADFPLGRLTAVSGVSGSGKSSLVMHTLLPAAQAAVRGEPPAAAAQIGGLEAFARVARVDQAPIGRTPRSTPATYTGLFGPLRELFAGLPEARTRGFGAERFSFNVKGGRCETCQGAGVVRVPMQFLPDVFVTCETCAGARYERETLAVRYRGFDIAAVLRASVDEATALLGHLPRIGEALASLRAVGLGYLRLGQSATTLSAGEAQRMRLSRELARRDSAHTLYVLDEPTAGLHPSEVELLIHVLEDLIENGHTVVVVEHNLALIARADHVIDLGPEAGSAGGRVIAAGTPAEIALCAHSHTGACLARTVAGRAAR